MSHQHFYNLLIILVVAVAIFGVMLLKENIDQRKADATEVVFRVAEINENTVDPAEWGKNFPQQFDGYKRTVDTIRTKHGGSEAFQKLDKFPVWKELFAGHAFGIDYREERGHAYMLSDQRETERVTKRKQPGACLHCHASIIPAYYKKGVEAGVAPDDRQAAIMKGFEEVCKMPYDSATKLVEHPVSCGDCHNPNSMQLRVNRPGFLNGISRLAESNYSIPHLPSIERWRQGKRSKVYNPNEDATRQEMRTFVCGQCHVEYHFATGSQLLTYPWHNGLRMEQAESYYDSIGFRDWTHSISGAPMLKAQHPEFEMWNQGIHAQSGVSCADCHMPYKRVGAIKISDHHIRSPLLNISRSCQTCHRMSEDELLARATNIVDKTSYLLQRSETACHDLIQTIKSAQEAGVDDAGLAEARQLHRKAQWRLDYVSAENSMGFHASQEAARILAEAADYARQGQIAALRAMASLKQLSQL